MARSPRQGGPERRSPRTPANRAAPYNRAARGQRSTNNADRADRAEPAPLVDSHSRQELSFVYIPENNPNTFRRKKCSDDYEDYECDTPDCNGQEYVTWRKCVSHFFGRNKKQTVQMDCIIPRLCRMCYQRKTFHSKDFQNGYATFQAGLIYKVLQRAEDWPGDRSWTITLPKEALEMLGEWERNGRRVDRRYKYTNDESLDGQHVQWVNDVLMPLTGQGRSTADCRNMVDLVSNKMPELGLKKMIHFQFLAEGTWPERPEPPAEREARERRYNRAMEIMAMQEAAKRELAAMNEATAGSSQQAVEQDASAAAAAPGSSGHMVSAARATQQPEPTSASAKDSSIQMPPVNEQSLQLPACGASRIERKLSPMEPQPAESSSRSNRPRSLTVSNVSAQRPEGGLPAVTTPNTHPARITLRMPKSV